MHRFLTFVIAVTISATAYAQKFPFGTYYFLPESSGSTTRELEIREVKISPTSIAERYVDRQLNPLTEGAMPSEYSIDAIVNKNGNFYFVFKKNDQYSYRVIRTATKDKLPMIEMRANNYRQSFYVKEDAIAAALQDTLPFLGMPHFTRAAMQKFSKLKPWTSMDIDSYKRILRKIVGVLTEQNRIYKTIPAELKSKYYVSRFFDISFRYFFVEEGFSPFVHGEDMENIYKKYKDDREVDELHDRI